MRLRRSRKPSAKAPRDDGRSLLREAVLDEADEAVDVGEREVAEGLDVGIRAEEARGDLGEVVGVARRGDEPGRDPIAQLGEESPVARDPDVPEEGRPVGLGEERREGGEEPLAPLGRSLDGVENRADGGSGALARAGPSRLADEPDEGIDAVLGRGGGEERLEGVDHDVREDSVPPRRRRAGPPERSERPYRRLRRTLATRLGVLSTTSIARSASSSTNASPACGIRPRRWMTRPATVA